jgi:hypothetical protein
MRLTLVLALALLTLGGCVYGYAEPAPYYGYRGPYYWYGPPASSSGDYDWSGGNGSSGGG